MIYISIKTEWATFLKSIFSNKEIWCQFEDQEPHIFYQCHLHQNLPLNLKMILGIVLTLPIGINNIFFSMIFI